MVQASQMPLSGGERVGGLPKNWEEGSGYPKNDENTTVLRMACPQWKILVDSVLAFLASLEAPNSIFQQLVGFY